MKSNKTVRKALWMSVLSIALCLTMLVGTTFAWFTDTASTAVNKIQSGTLDVVMSKDATGENSIEGTTLNWVKAEGAAANEAVLWEPGCTYNLDSFYIVNKGNLALKYKVVISGIDGSSKLMNAIDFTITEEGKDPVDLATWNGGVLLPSTAAAGTAKAGEQIGHTGKLTITGKMRTDAGNEYQGLSIDGVGITVYATQYTYENDSKGNTYDDGSTYPNGVTIAGLAGNYKNLTAAAKAWRESKGVVTSGGTFGMNSLGTVDSITWVVSGEVATGDGEGVIGNNGAGQSIFGGGYFTPSVTVNNIVVKGVNGAKIAKTGDAYLVSAAGKNVVYENITFVDTVRIDSNPANLTFKNCTFEAGFRMPHSATDANVTIENCVFTGNESSGYAIFAQGNMASFKINGNNISDCQRGINVQAGNNAVVTINGNTIQNVTGKTDGFTYGAAIQLTSAKTFTVTNNTISGVAVNALHIYNGCAADSIVISDNNITAAYLCWNEANYTNVTSSGNTLDITYAGKCVTKTAEVDSGFVLN